MRQKLFFVSLMFVLTTNHLQAQDYPVFLNNSCWRVQLADFVFRRVVWLIPEKDTIIGAFSYKKYIDSAKNRLVSFIREDVANKRVYRWWGFAGDKILFDFSLKLGDSIVLANNVKYKVVSVDSITVYPGTKRRTLKLVNSNYPRQEYWVEGVGTLEYPIINNWELPSDPAYYLLCSYQNGVPLYNAASLPPFCQGNCCPIPPIVGDSKKHIYKWFPNPFQYKSTYLSEEKLESVTMKVYNTLGQLVNEQKGISGYTLNFFRNSLPNGLYFVQLWQDQKVISTSKLILSR